MNAAEIQGLAHTHPHELAVSFQKALVDFGYAGLDLKDVKDAIKSYLDGGKPSGVIQMFVHRWMKEGTE